MFTGTSVFSQAYSVGSSACVQCSGSNTGKGIALRGVFITKGLALTVAVK